MGLDPKRIRVVSIMPCTAKKDEIVRPQLVHDGVPEVDVVLTTREFARLLKREGVDFRSLEPSEFDNPYMSEFSGAGAIFGTTGGVMEAALRTIYDVVNGRELEQVELTQLRGFEGVRAATVELGGDIGEVKVAMAHGLKPTRQIVEAVLAGTADFDFIEIMACPGGCVDGGGTLRSKKRYLNHALKRRETLFGIDREAKARQSHNNPQVQALIAISSDSPNSENAHKLLHTRYTDRQLEMTRTVGEIWREHHHEHADLLRRVRAAAARAADFAVGAAFAAAEPCRRRTIAMRHGRPCEHVLHAFGTPISWAILRRRAYSTLALPPVPALCRETLQLA